MLSLVLTEGGVSSGLEQGERGHPLCVHMLKRGVLEMGEANLWELTLNRKEV